jgi:DNA-binding NtrC family response regulator
MKRSGVESAMLRGAASDVSIDVRPTSGIEEVDVAARATVPVLITEASQSRRHGFARFIHEHSRFQGGPFITLSCRTGDSRDGNAAFDMRSTVEHARGGSVFLDDVGCMSHEAQVELFVFLTEQLCREAGASDGCGRWVRVITGTDSPLLPSISDGAFDEGLFYRLNVIHVVAESV